MSAATGRSAVSRSRTAEDDCERTHPTWRRAVAGGMAAVFALSLAVVGLMLCTGPLLVP